MHRDISTHLGIGSLSRGDEGHLRKARSFSLRMAALTAAHASQYEHHRPGRVHLRDGPHAGLWQSQAGRIGTRSEEEQRVIERDLATAIDSPFEVDST